MLNMEPETVNIRKLLLIGGAGYIGSVVCAYLLELGFHVTVLDALYYQHGACLIPNLRKSNFNFLLGDFTCESTVKSVLADVTDVVILAGFVGDPITKKYPDFSDQVNLTGMRNFIKLLEHYPLRKVIFISTCSNYGLITKNILADEDFELKPLSLYAKAKVEIEKFILSQKNNVDYCAIILRFATAFGLSPRMRFDLTVNEFVRDLYLGKELTVYDADTWRPYCHVLDFARALHYVLEAPKNDVYFEVFNAGSEKNNYTKKMIIETIQQYIPTSKVCYQKHGADPRNYRVDFNKIKKVLNFEAQYSVSDGVCELLGALEKKCFEDVDQRKNFYGNHEIFYHKINSPQFEAV